MQKKPKLFVGSSREAIPYAEGVIGHLARITSVRAWFSPDRFQAGEYTMEALERNLDECDFALFFFSADDLAEIRTKKVFITRDNTLFEAGLFWGKLRRKRVFCLIPESVEAKKFEDSEKIVEDYHLLSDFSGLTMINYEVAEDKKYADATLTASIAIKERIESEGFFVNPLILLQQKDEELSVKQSILRFFYRFNSRYRNGTEKERYTALASAMQIALRVPPNFDKTNAALWRKINATTIKQVGGNIAQDRVYDIEHNQGLPEAERIGIVDTLIQGRFKFSVKQHFEKEAILCYPLSNEFAISIHVLSEVDLKSDVLEEIIATNKELLDTLSYLVEGGEH